MKYAPRTLTTSALLLALLGASLLLGPARTFGQERDEAPVRGTISVERGADLEALARITPARAKAAARSRFSGATAEEAALENEDGYLVYAVDLNRNGQEMEVLVDAGNGSVLRVEADNEEEDAEKADEENEQYEEDEGGEAESGEWGEENEAGEESEAGEEGGGHAMRAELPGAVKAAFHKKYPRAEIVGTDREHENGSTFYEVESRDGGLARDLLYRSDGRVYEIEEQVAAGALPAAVRRAAEAQGQIVKAERVTRGGKTEYEIAVRQDGKQHAVVLDADGRVIEGS